MSIYLIVGYDTRSILGLAVDGAGIILLTVVTNDESSPDSSRAAYVILATNMASVRQFLDIRVFSDTQQVTNIIVSLFKNICSISARF